MKILKCLIEKIVKPKCNYRACASCDEEKLICTCKNRNEITPNGNCKHFVDKTR